ncbi:TPA: toxin [Serratia marcescens]|nr:toxin [Serratia marcescens]
MKTTAIELGGLPAPAIYQQLLTFLLDRHYGLTLNDTPYSDPEAVRTQIDTGASIRETINDLVEEHCLVRIDRNLRPWMEHSAYLSAGDILRAYRAIGLSLQKS